MTGSLEKKVTVIIRSVGERTEQLCHELILAQGVPKENVFIIHKSPFSAALRESFSIGIKRDLPWTLCNDADVLLRQGSISQLIQIAKTQKKNICEIQGYVLDKFFGGPRGGGPHLYRTALLPKLIEHVPHAGHDIRPETYALEKMRSEGFPWKKVKYLTGLHDFEQYYRDIFRKCFVYAHKHQHLTDLFLGVWRTNAEIDRDFQIALKGFAAGIEHYNDVFIDVFYDDNFFNKVNLGIKEKDESSISTINSPEFIEEIILNWVELPIYQERYGSPLKTHPFSINELKDIVIEKFSKLGFLRIFPYLLGSILSKIGKWLKEQVT